MKAVLISRKVHDKAFLLHVGLTVLFGLFFVYLAFKYQAVPVSDYKIYWDTTGNWDQYIQGGFLLLFYLPFKWLGFPPFLAALVVNSAFWLSFCWCLYGFQGKSIQKCATLSLIPVGFWWAGMSPLVCSDLPHVALIILGMKFARSYLKDYQKRDLVLAALWVLMGLSVRRQGLFTCLVVLAFLGICLLIGGMEGKLKPFLRSMGLLLGLSILLAVVGDSWLTTHSVNREEARVNARENFYQGFFTPVMDPHTCGSYTVESDRIVEAERDLPFLAVIQKHVFTRPLSDDLKIMGWKVVRFLRFKYFSFQTLQGSLPPGTVSPMRLNPFLDEHPTLKHWAYRVLGISPDNPKPIELSEISFWWVLETLFAMLFKLALIVLGFLYGKVLKAKKGPAREKLLYLLPFLVYLSYVFLHSIMEIQARYILGPLLFTFAVGLYFFDAVGEGDVFPRWFVPRELKAKR